MKRIVKISLLILLVGNFAQAMDVPDPRQAQDVPKTIQARAGDGAGADFVGIKVKDIAAYESVEDMIDEAMDNDLPAMLVRYRVNKSGRIFYEYQFIRSVHGNYFGKSAATDADLNKVEMPSPGYYRVVPKPLKNFLGGEGWEYNPGAVIYLGQKNGAEAWNSAMGLYEGMRGEVGVITDRYPIKKLQGRYRNRNRVMKLINPADRQPLVGNLEYYAMFPADEKGQFVHIGSDAVLRGGASDHQKRLRDFLKIYYAVMDKADNMKLNEIAKQQKANLLLALGKLLEFDAKDKPAAYTVYQGAENLSVQRSVNSKIKERLKATKPVALPRRVPVAQPRAGQPQQQVALVGAQGDQVQELQRQLYELYPQITQGVQRGLVSKAKIDELKNLIAYQVIFLEARAVQPGEVPPGQGNVEIARHLLGVAKQNFIKLGGEGSLLSAIPGAVTAGVPARPAARGNLKANTTPEAVAAIQLLVRNKYAQYNARQLNPMSLLALNLLKDELQKIVNKQASLLVNPYQLGMVIGADKDAMIDRINGLLRAIKSSYSKLGGHAADLLPAQPNRVAPAPAVQPQQRVQEGPPPLRQPVAPVAVQWQDPVNRAKDAIASGQVSPADIKAIQALILQQAAILGFGADPYIVTPGDNLRTLKSMAVAASRNKLKIRLRSM